MFRKLFIVSAALLSLSSFSVAAQDGVAQSADQVIATSGGKDVDAAAQLKSQTNPDETSKQKENLTNEQLELKVKLAQKMHNIRPTGEQIDSAIDQVASRLPEIQKNEFMKIMKESLNYNAIEKISIDAMVEVFTLSELQAMVDYYSKPDAISASDKMDDWAMLVKPEISKLIDGALMKIRVGQ